MRLLKALQIGQLISILKRHTKGTLEEGKLADMVVLDKNPLKVPEEEIKNIVVLETYKEGVQVYKK
jgi:predicted amidohydrolase YtcJ